MTNLQMQIAFTTFMIVVAIMIFMHMKHKAIMRTRNKLSQAIQDCDNLRNRVKTYKNPNLLDIKEDMQKIMKAREETIFYLNDDDTAFVLFQQLTNQLEGLSDAIDIVVLKKESLNSSNVPFTDRYNATCRELSEKHIENSFANDNHKSSSTKRNHSNYEGSTNYNSSSDNSNGYPIYGGGWYYNSTTYSDSPSKHSSSHSSSNSYDSSSSYDCGSSYSSSDSSSSSSSCDSSSSSCDSSSSCGD